MAVSHHAPRASAELFPESLKLSPKQREVLSTLQTFPEGARAADVAQALGMHVNTARGHLDELVAQDAVRVITAPAQGRGRPSLIFQVRIPDSRAIAEEYVTLIEVLASMVADKDSLSEADWEKARSIGMRWARAMQDNGVDLNEDNHLIGPLFRRLRDMGFDPTVAPHEVPAKGAARPMQDNENIDLNACPFTTSGMQPSRFICAVHDGFLQEVAKNNTNGKLQLKLIPKSGPGTCAVHVRSQTS